MRDEQNRRRREDELRVSPPQVRKYDDVIDTRRQQYQQHGEVKGRMGRKELDQPEYHQRNRNEVDDQQRREEAPVRQRLPEGSHRHLQEGDIQQRSQRRIDPGFQGGSGWPRDAGKHCHEINGDLMLFQRRPGDANHAWKMHCATAGVCRIGRKTGRPPAVPRRSRNILRATGKRRIAGRSAHRAHWRCRT